MRWAVATGRTSSQMEGIAHTWNGPSEMIDSEERWVRARQLLHDNTLKLDDRVAGLLVLLYAQQAAKISRLSIVDVDMDTEAVRLRLGATPVELPAPIAGLVRGLVTARAGHAAVGRPATMDWLFPGGQPGKPISAAHMGQRLRALGIRPNPARSAALFSLATELPAAILARMLGIAIDVAVDWQHLASGDWTHYAAEISLPRPRPAHRRTPAMTSRPLADV